MADERSSPQPIRAMTALVIVATFLAGAAAGAGLYHWWAPRWPPSPPPPPPPFGFPLEALGLSPEQATTAREIGERHRAELEAVLRETYPQVRAINDEMARELRAILTPEQARRLDALRTQRPPPPGAPPGGPPPPGSGWGVPGPPGPLLPGLGPPGPGPPGPGRPGTGPGPARP